LGKTAVLDASALMALLRGEKGAEAVDACLSDAVVSTVNQAEVQTKLVSAGMDPRVAWWHISELKCHSIPFDESLAQITGALVEFTKPLGLSLGDRACLALAMQLHARALTADRSWKKLSLGIEIEVIR
jgi:ribonuclease VapC